TFPFSINARGLIVGYFQDPSGATHGFLRNSTGAVSTFDVPGSISTVRQSINTGGDFTGTWQGANFTVHGFLETSGGKLTLFDVAGAIQTNPTILNSDDAITGYYADANDVIHSFVRDPHGNVTTFDAPGVGPFGGSRFGTQALGINAGGTITGFYADATPNSHGFVRAPDGTITVFDAPGAGTGNTGCQFPPCIGQGT